MQNQLKYSTKDTAGILLFLRVCALCMILFYISISFQSSHLTGHAANANSAIDDKIKTSANSMIKSHEIIVMLKQGISPSEKDAFLKQYHLLPILEETNNYILFQVPENYEVSSLLCELNTASVVHIAEENQEFDVFYLTEDPYSDTQWGLDNPGYYTHIVGSTSGLTYAKEDMDLNVFETWNYVSKLKKSNKEVIVAIIDTGVDTKHPDLENRIWNNSKEIPADGIDNDKNGYVDDIEGWDFYNNDNTVCHYRFNSLHDIKVANPTDNDDHGTHCAGIIAANANNQIGIAGIASNVNVKIMPLKIHGGVQGKGTIANAIKAIQYATSMGADICNMSWGTEHYSEALKTAISESSMLFVTAAGNTGANNDVTPLYPASYSLDNIISVTFVDANGRLTLDSNFGSQSVDLAAPGTDIFSTIVGSYRSLSGSSMATPHVSAIAAMIYSREKYQYAADIKQHIVNRLKFLPDLEGYVRYPGIPDALKIISSLSQLTHDSIPPVITVSTRYDQDKFVLDLVSKDEGPSGVRVIRYAIGNRNADYFKKGSSGLSIEENPLTLSKSGQYTFYISDYAGNETILPYLVEEDVTPPQIKVKYKVAKDYKSITLTGTITDKESGIKSAKYYPGVKTVDDFRSGNQGIPITVDKNSFKFDASMPGRYTIYAQDYRGNKSVSIVNARIIKSTDLLLNRQKKELGVGKNFRLLPTLLPENSTDVVSYLSSNKKVVTVSKYGLLTGISPGKATVFAVTASGVRASCVVTVKYPKE